MSHHFAEHTGELELLIEGATAEAVLAEAAAALSDLFDAPAGGTKVTREIAVEAPDLPTLLADWLEELVALADTEGFVPDGDLSLTLDGPRLHANVQGRLAAPRPLVKAVTYHDLELRQGAGKWRGRVVLDV